MVANVSSVPQLNEFESAPNGIFNLATRGVGTEIRRLSIRGNSFLSGVYVKSMSVGATLKINYYDYTTDDGTERNPLNSHTLITSTSTEADKVLVTRFHDKPVCEYVVTGGTVEFSVYITVIADPLVDINFNAPENSKITHVSCPVADTEVSHTLSANVQKIFIFPLTKANIKFSFVATESGSKYVLIPKNNSFTIDDIKFPGSTLYLQCDIINTVIVFELF